MKISNLGYQTDFSLIKFEGQIEDRGNYLVIRSPKNPGYFWGNLLFFQNPPSGTDYKVWTDIFKKEFPKSNHMTFAWDDISGREGVNEEFLKHGFKKEKSIVLSTESVDKNENYNSKVKVKPLDSEVDFRKAVEIQIELGGDYLSKESWRSYHTKAMAVYRGMIDKGLGKWFGAYIDGELAGSLGIFVDSGVGRFQQVNTVEKFQRRGVCSTLVYESAKYAFENMKAEKLVMVADENYHAAKIYESVGFRPGHRQSGLCWWDSNIHS